MRDSILGCAAVLLSLALGCGDDATATTDAGGGGDSGTSDAAPAGSGALRFQLVWGGGAGSQIDPSWRDQVPGWDPDATLVVLLCGEDDPTCEAPLRATDLSGDATDGVPLAEDDGPAIRLTGLPVGRHHLMVVADSTASREQGFAWDDDFAGAGTAWGGVASEGDLLLSDPEDAPGPEHNPEPLALEVDVGDAEQDLGTLVLGHYHERDVSPEPPAGEGTLAVAVGEGLRLVDLETHAVLDPDGDGDPVVRMSATSGDPVEGEVCGLVDGPDGTVFVLYRDPAGGGFAIPYDVRERAQPYAGNAVLFVGDTEDTPCRGIFHEHGGHQYLFVANALAAPDREPGDGMWYARIDDLASGHAGADFMGSGDEPVLGLGVGDLAAVEGTLYLSISAEASEGAAPPVARGKHAAYVAPFAVDGRPSLRGGTGAYDVRVGPALSAGVTSPEGMLACDGEVGTAGLAAARFHDGRTLLFLGGCLEIDVFDLATGDRLDFNGPLAGEPGLDASLFGQGFAWLAPSSDGRRVWAIPQAVSPVPFFLGEEDDPFPRHMALPLDLTSGDLPSVASDFAGRDVDGYEGHPSGGFPSPAEDPGVDLRYTSHLGYLLTWAPGLDDETFTGVVAMRGVTAVDAGGCLWVQSATGGLGKGASLATYDLSSGVAVLWPRRGRGFYGIWTGGPGLEPRFGFDLAPDLDEPPATHGVALVR